MRDFNLHNNGEFSLVNRTEPLLPFFKVDIQEHSIGQIKGRQIFSKNYLRRYNHDTNQQTTAIRFNWHTHQALYQQTSNQAGTKNRTLAFNGEAYDPLSFHLAIKRDVAAGKKFLSYYIADRGKLKRYRFQVMDSIQLPTTIGTLNTIVVEQIAKTSRSSKFWLAKNKNLLLVRYEQRRKQKPYFDIRIHSYEQGIETLDEGRMVTKKNF